MYKRWIYSNKVDYELVCDYLQKISYSIQDYNHLISQKLSREKKGIPEGLSISNALANVYLTDIFCKPDSRIHRV